MITTAFALSTNSIFGSAYGLLHRKIIFNWLIWSWLLYQMLALFTVFVSFNRMNLVMKQLIAVFFHSTITEYRTKNFQWNNQSIWKMFVFYIALFCVTQLADVYAIDVCTCRFFSAILNELPLIYLTYLRIVLICLCVFCVFWVLHIYFGKNNVHV